MSSKSAKKNVPATKATNVVVTRKKSTQQNRQVRAKNKKIIKSVVDKEPPKPEIKSTITPTATCQKDTPLKTKVKHLVQLVEQVEYYPDKLKREMCAKKVFLKPKHNFKVIAVANKRKLSVPQKGGMKSTLLLKSYSRSSVKSTKSNNSPEISMIDMVKLIEDNHSLSDEDFMEILTCPSPVWWEDPPDERYIEDAICTRLPSPSSPLNKSRGDDNKTEEQTINRTSTPSKLSSLIDFENVIEEFKISPTINEKFNKKKQKLENVLGSIKNVKENKINKNNTPVKDCKKHIVKNTKIIKIGKGESKNVSSATDEEDLSDLSFNEEEVLKNLENMDIPIEQEQHFIQRKKEKELQTLKNIQAINSLNRDALNKVKVPDILPPLKRKPDLNINNIIKQDYSDNLDYNLDAVSHSNFRFISDDDLSLAESNSKLNSKKMKIVNISSSLGESSSILDVDSVDFKDYAIKTAQSDDSSVPDNIEKDNDIIPKKVINDLSEYITVYKIVSNDNEKNELNSETSNKSPETTSNKVDNVRGKLNNFFKKCKSGKRLKKSDVTFPSISVRDIKDLKMEKENSDVQTYVENEENRLKPCDYCVVETENGAKNFSCDSCEKAPIFACTLCDFLADTKELYKNHVSKCKDVARITWKNNFIINQT
ncbi:unnamed protein product [Arctia plantaginis]|uniref:Uncharacterized protein n=1 Tax=Arctia plantaginis TaxID=874455 RepID=A0A8S1BIG4_ARCPL|nr:unnamed protein product [Arctia plantaginis]